MDKPTPAAIAAFTSALPDDPRIVRRKMFGCDAAFVNGHMFAGVFEGGVTLRLGEAGSLAACNTPGVSAFEPMPGRPWKNYVLADAKEYGGSDALAAWVAQALTFTATLPPKPAKKRKTA